MSTAIVTGASAGIGLWTARDLALAGARLGLICRDADRAETARRFVLAAAPAARVDVWLADLSSRASVRTLAKRLRDAYDAIDVLVNNAGAVFGRRQLSTDGIEMHLATNYVGHFLLTASLLDRLLAGHGRVINVTSSLHAFARMRFDDLHFERWYHLVPAYAQSKLALALFTFELARRTDPRRLGAHCVDPGFVDTRIVDGAGPIQRQLARPLAWWGRSPSSVSGGIAQLAMDPALCGQSGGYFVRGHPRRPARRARDPEVARAWWEHSRRWLAPEEADQLDQRLQN